MQTEAKSDLKALPKPRETDEQRYQYICATCGESTTNTYVEPVATRMLENRHCYFCDHWEQEKKRIERDHARMTIIGGRVYGPGNRTTGSFRGMSGRRFDIEYIEPSKHAGKRITTFDLWAGSTMPERMRERFPDTARFLNGAIEAKAGETTCWNPSERKAETYPKPATLDLA